MAAGPEIKITLRHFPPLLGSPPLSDRIIQSTLAGSVPLLPSHQGAPGETAQHLLGQLQSFQSGSLHAAQEEPMWVPAPPPSSSESTVTTPLAQSTPTSEDFGDTAGIDNPRSPVQNKRRQLAQRIVIVDRFIGGSTSSRWLLTSSVLTDSRMWRAPADSISQAGDKPLANWKRPLPRKGVDTWRRSCSCMQDENHRSRCCSLSA